MKILMVNKFLHPNGGSENYMFKLGFYLQSKGHDVQYFGMEHEKRCVENDMNMYTSDMNFRDGINLSKMFYPIKTIYSKEARRKIRAVLDNFSPDIVHLNNFNYQLTPSIILEIRKWEKVNKTNINIIFTAHDYNLICPNHMLNNPNSRENCEKCINGKFINCTKGKCIHGSTVKSFIGSLEGYFWKMQGVYKKIDKIICPSQFMKSKMDSNPDLASKTTVILNFVDKMEYKQVQKGEYILYFGRFSEEKGIKTLLTVCKTLPHIQFVFAGTGPLKEEIDIITNINNMGFQSGIMLENLIREALFTICPSEWYENCPFSVMESQMYMTPVLGANIGGIPELIQKNITGELFESGNFEELRNKIIYLWEDRELLEQYSKNCRNIMFDTIDEYYEKLMKVYGY